MNTTKRDYGTLMGVRVTKEVRRRMEAIRRTRGISFTFQMRLALLTWLEQQELREERRAQ